MVFRRRRRRRRGRRRRRRSGIIKSGQSRVNFLCHILSQNLVFAKLLEFGVIVVVDVAAFVVVFGLTLGVGGVAPKSGRIRRRCGFRLPVHHLVELDVVPLGEDFDVVRGAVPRAPSKDQCYIDDGRERDQGFVRVNILQLIAHGPPSA